MTNEIILDGSVDHRADAAIARLEENKTSILFRSVIALACVFGLLAAPCLEYFSAGVGFRAAFPPKSDGTSLADDIMGLRYAIVGCLILGGLVLHAISKRAGVWLPKLLNLIGLVAIIVLVCGVGAFMLSATLLSGGVSDGTGDPGRLVWLSLGAASAAMLTLSFLAAHTLLTWLFRVLPDIAQGVRERRAIAIGKRLLVEADGHRRRRAAYEHIADELAKPNEAERRAATECAQIVGIKASKAHELWASATAKADANPAPHDHTNVPDVPLSALERLRDDLRKYNFAHFFTILTEQKEA